MALVAVRVTVKNPMYSQYLIMKTVTPESIISSKIIYMYFLTSYSIINILFVINFVMYFGLIFELPLFQLLWVRREGGSNARDHIKRVLVKMFSTDVQLQINRTGGYGKLKLHDYIETIIKSEYMYLLFIPLIYR